MQEGLVTNNGTNNVTFAVGETDQTATPGTGFYANGSSSPTPYAAFGTQFLQTTPLANTPATPASYTVQDGDTLESIAQAMWGDSSLWYKIADANGISGDSDLTVGESLTIPTDVSTADNNSTTNTVYNTAQAIGNTSPTHPKPPSHHGGCGVIGEILETIVAVAVSILTVGIGSPLAAAAVAAATDAAEQGIGLATGLQSKFSWSQVGLAAIGGAVGFEVSDTGIFDALGDDIGEALGDSSLADDIGGYIGDALQGAASNAITQGIGVATGLQSKFSWASVAAAGVSAGIGSAVEGQTQGVDFGLGKSGNATFVGVLSGTARLLADAATRTLISGTDFGDNIIAALPDTLGQTIGNAIGGASNPSEVQAQATPQPSSSGLSQAELDDIMNTVNNLPVQEGVVGDGATGDTVEPYTPPEPLYVVSQEVAGTTPYGAILRTTYDDGSYIDTAPLPPPDAPAGDTFDPYPLDTAIAQFLSPVTAPINRVLQEHVPINVQVGSYGFHANPTVGQLALPVLAVGTIVAPEVFGEVDAEVLAGEGVAEASSETAGADLAEVNALRSASVGTSYTATEEATTYAAASEESSSGLAAIAVGSRFSAIASGASIGGFAGGTEYYLTSPNPSVVGGIASVAEGAVDGGVVASGIGLGYAAVAGGTAHSVQQFLTSLADNQLRNYGNTPQSVGGKVLYDALVGGVTTPGGLLISQRVLGPFLGRTAAAWGASVFANPSVDEGAAAFVISASEKYLPMAGDYLVGVGQSLLNDVVPQPTAPNPNNSRRD